MSDRITALFANEAFYAAFANRDVLAMDDVWSKQDSVTCIHPGWAPLFGRDAVMRSWQAILDNPQAPQIQSVQPSATLFGTVASVLCYELIEDTFLIASNLFVLENGTWKMVHHQAAPVPPPELDAVDDPTTSLQ